MQTIRQIKLSRMMEDFPPSELIPYSNVRNNIENGVFDAMYLTENGVNLAYAILTAIDGMDYVIGNYLAVHVLYRDKGIGSEFLKRIIEKYHEKIIIIEVEDPQAAATEEEKKVRERRIHIYNKAGFRIVPTKRANILGVEIQIMANTDKKNNEHTGDYKYYIFPFAGSTAPGIH